MRIGIVWIWIAAFAAASAWAAREEVVWKDDFSDARKIEKAENVARMRVYPRVPMMPDARVDKAGCGYFPSIVKVPNGDLVAAWHEPQHAVDMERGRDLAAWWADVGKMWSEPMVVIAVPNVDDRDPVVRMGRNGRVWLGAAG